MSAQVLLLLLEDICSTRGSSARIQTPAIDFLPLWTAIIALTQAVVRSQLFKKKKKKKKKTLWNLRVSAGRCEIFRAGRTFGYINSIQIGHASQPPASTFHTRS